MTSTPLSRPSAASKQTVHNAGPGGAKPAWKSIAAGWSGAVLATGGYAAAADPRSWLPVWAVLWWAAFTHDGRYALAGVPKLPNQLA